MGKLIVIEGACDGIGKTTQYEKLINRLKSEGEDIIYHHFPSYDTYQGKGVENYLKGNFGNRENLPEYFIYSLYSFDRAVTWYQDLKKYYEEGKTIILDRYSTSALIYQSCSLPLENRKYFIDYMQDFEYEKIGIAKPDLVIFLNADFDKVKKLRDKRNENKKEDIHEKDIEYMKNVYENSLFVSNYLNWYVVNCIKDDNFRSIEDIHEEIYQLVKNEME